MPKKYLCLTIIIFIALNLSFCTRAPVTLEKLDTDIKTNDTVQTEITDIPETTGIPDISQSDEEFVVTPNGKKYHDPDCGAVKTIKEYLKKEQAVEKGYEPCAICKPDGYVTK